MPPWPSKVSGKTTEAALTSRAAVWSQPFSLPFLFSPYLFIHTTPEWVVCYKIGLGLTGSPSLSSFSHPAAAVVT